MIDRSVPILRLISLHNFRIKIFYKLLFLVAISPPSSLSSNPDPDYSDSDLIIYEENGIKYKMDAYTCPYGTYFQQQSTVNCVCSRGLWVFYGEACGDPSFIHASENFICSSITVPLKKSLLVTSKFEPTFTSLHPTHGMVLQLTQSLDNIVLEMNDSEVILVTGEWSIEYENGVLACLGNEEDFCLYESKVLPDAEKIISIQKVTKCAPGKENNKNSIMVIPPWNCTRFSREKTNEMCDQDLSNEVDDVDANSLPNPGSPSRVRRAPGAKKPGAKKSGRTFLTTSMAMNSAFEANYNAALSKNSSSGNSTVPEDEDDEKVNREGNMVIKSQIWNFITEAANEVMLLSSPRGVDTDIKIPAYRFLEISKEIIKKTCPQYYVPSAHWDLAVSIFRAVQNRDIIYDEPSVSHADMSRIERVLTLCLENVTTFNFSRLNQVNCSAFTLNSVYKPTTERPEESDGKFVGYGNEESFVNVPGPLSPFYREPIIETVWNVFTHAHSKCYPFFDNMQSSFNDHHRFTTIMMTLFTNKILPMWTEITELAPDIYSGFLGNARRLLSGVAHCAVAGRFDPNANDTDAQYPWDLIKPGGPPNIAATAAPAPVRRKRSLQVGNPQVPVGCLSNINQNSYICQE